MLEHYDNPRGEDECQCGRGKCLIQCHDCFHAPPTCASCFAERHHRLPFHFALVWDPLTGHFTRKDYSSVLPGEAFLRLGHADFSACQSSKTTIKFTVVHTNGIHESRARFCDCPDAKDRITQLMRARLFPATANEPKTAFTFEVLKQFSMHNLQSKCGAFDYMKSLYRLTNNVSFDGLPVSETVINGILYQIIYFTLLGSIQGSPPRVSRLGVSCHEQACRSGKRPK
jgi:hypothetical protein